MVVKFVVKNGNEVEKEYSFENNNTIKDLKQKIINDYDLKCKCIDLYLVLDRPIRGMGKYTLENGLLQRSMDNYSMDKFNIEDKTLLANFTELENEYIDQKKQFSLSNENYVPPSRKRKELNNNNNKNKELDLNDLNEFPPLC